MTTFMSCSISSTVTFFSSRMRVTNAMKSAVILKVQGGKWTYAYSTRWNNNLAKYTRKAHDEKVSWYSLSSPEPPPMSVT